MNNFTTNNKDISTQPSLLFCFSKKRASVYTLPGLFNGGGHMAEVKGQSTIKDTCVIPHML